MYASKVHVKDFNLRKQERELGFFCELISGFPRGADSGVGPSGRARRRRRGGVGRAGWGHEC